MNYPKYSDEWFASLYLQYGSAERVLQHCYRAGDPLPISLASFHRLINKKGIIKSVGRRNTHLGEALYFFAHKASEPALPLAKIYREYMPLEFETSIVSLHRIYNRVKSLEITKTAVALLISPTLSSDRVLVADETTSSLRYGRYKGDSSIPMTFSEKDEEAEKSILRVLQQEVFVDKAIAGDLRNMSFDYHHYMDFDILDVKVRVYKILVDNENLKFSSFKLRNHRFVNTSDISKGIEGVNFRWGVEEIINRKPVSALNLMLASSL